eukprot:CAMPEP_0177763314 /NCGR_PEP_ID=MMETSP0491_2-20121128/6805_1 /TAXON_ID=63592 /ORGANISM="Tetraselmis chuii, Strain PLY429" /LENGTH=170 /DNA_ID=CAMNT_0019279413 /DNA_START=216 /DNA_END=728 /DNA_ORIENTATION=-
MTPIGRKKTRSGSPQQQGPTRASTTPANNRPSSNHLPAFQPSNPTDLFFLGRALLETINDRVTSAFLDILSEASKTSAELPAAFLEFQDEVMARAQSEMSKSGSSTGTSSSRVGSTTLVAPAPTSSQPAVDLQEVVDDLRAELAAARAAAQAVKNKGIGTMSPLNGATKY